MISVPARMPPCLGSGEALNGLVCIDCSRHNSTQISAAVWQVLSDMPVHPAWALVLPSRVGIFTMMETRHWMHVVIDDL